VFLVFGSAFLKAENYIDKIFWKVADKTTGTMVEKSCNYFRKIEIVFTRVNYDV
jgi:hypothetical protein